MSILQTAQIPPRKHFQRTLQDHRVPEIPFLEAACSKSVR